MPTINELYHRRGFGFLTEEDLKQLVTVDRLQTCLVRCEHGRFSTPAQDVKHFVDIITASGKDRVRDVSILFAGTTTAKPGPIPSPAERGEPFKVPSNGIADRDPLDMPEEDFEAWVKCLANPADQANWKYRRREKQKRQEAASATPSERASRDSYRWPPNGPTGHGDECHSDADPGL